MAGPAAFCLHIVVAFLDPLSSPAWCLFPSFSFSSYQSLLLSRILASIVRRYCSISTSLHHHLRLLLAPITAAKPAPSGTYIVITNYILSLSLSLSLSFLFTTVARDARSLHDYWTLIVFFILGRSSLVAMFGSENLTHLVALDRELCLSFFFSVPLCSTHVLSRL